MGSKSRGGKKDSMFKKYKLVFLFAALICGGLFVQAYYFGDSLNSIGVFSSLFQSDDSPALSLGTTTTSSASTTCKGVVQLFTDINYKGTSAGFALGKYTLAKLQACHIPNDSLSSVKVQSGYRITLYQDDNFGGALITRTADDATLVDDGWNDRASSINVELASAPPPQVNGGSATDWGNVTYTAHNGKNYTLHGYSSSLVSFYVNSKANYSIDQIKKVLGWYGTCKQTYSNLYGSVAGPYFTDHRGVKIATVAVVPDTCGAGCGAGMKAEILQGSWDTMDINKPGDLWIGYYELGRGTHFPFYDHLDALNIGSLIPHYTALQCGRAIGIDIFGTGTKYPGFSKEVNAFKSDTSLTMLEVYKETAAGKQVKRNNTEIIPWDVMAVVFDDLHNQYGIASMKKLFSALSIPGVVTSPQAALCNFEKGVKTAMGQTAVTMLTTKWKLPKCNL